MKQYEKIVNRIIYPRSGKMTTYVNLYSYRILRQLSGVTETFDRIYLDGFMMTWIFRILGHKLSRRSFDMSSMAEDVFAEADYGKGGIILLGGEEGIASRAADVIRGQFPNIYIMKTVAGYFSSDREREEIAQQLASSGATIIIVGMGAGKQEEMLTIIKNCGYDGEGYTCGGFLHQTAAGKIQYYPTIINKLGLRWAYRCYKEPKVIKRIIIDYPISALLLLNDYITWKKRRKSNI